MFINKKKISTYRILLINKMLPEKLYWQKSLQNLGKFSARHAANGLSIMAALCCPNSTNLLLGILLELLCYLPQSFSFIRIVLLFTSLIFLY